MENAHAGGHRREGLPHPLYPGDRQLHRLAASRHSIAPAGQPGREPLGAAAEEFDSVVWRGAGLVGEVSEAVELSRHREERSDAAIQPGLLRLARNDVRRVML